MNDNEILTIKELSEVMNISRSQIYKYRREGYQMEFGIRTTAGHFKAWLREYYAKKRQEEQADLTMATARLQ